MYMTMSVIIRPAYLATGGNRHPSAADWDSDSGVLAYGADRNIALWNPEVSGYFHLSARFFQ